jgi:hypothetical protein
MRVVFEDIFDSLLFHQHNLHSSESVVFQTKVEDGGVPDDSLNVSVLTLSCLIAKVTQLRVGGNHNAGITFGLLQQLETRLLRWESLDNLFNPLLLLLIQLHVHATLDRRMVVNADMCDRSFEVNDRDRGRDRDTDRDTDTDRYRDRAYVKEKKRNLFRDQSAALLGICDASSQGSACM